MGRKRKHEDNRQVILDTAERLFGQYGFSRTSVDDIAKAAGLGKASLYAEFASKDDMLMGVVLRIFHRILQDMDAMVGSAPPEQSPLLTLKNGLLYHIESLRGYAEQHFHGEDLLPKLEPPSQSQQHDFMQEVMQLHAWIAARLQEAVDREELPKELDPMQSAMLLHMGLKACFPPDSVRPMPPFTAQQGGLKPSDKFPFPESNHAIAAKLIDLMLNGFKHAQTLAVVLMVLLFGWVATLSPFETVAMA